MRKLRILMLISNFGSGGAQRVFHEHAVEFSSRYVVEEAVFDIKASTRVYDNGLQFHELKRTDWISKLGPLGRLISRAFALRNLVKSNQYDLVISHMDGANWVNALSFSKARKLLVVHGSITGDRSPNWKVLFFRRFVAFRVLYPSADRVVAVSKSMEQELHEVGVQNCNTIQNWFDTTHILNLAKEPIPRSVSAAFRRENVLLTAGRIVEQKQQGALIHMLKELKRREQDVCLVILGEGPMKEAYLALCEQLELSTWTMSTSNMNAPVGVDVYFLGYNKNPFAMISKATLFLFPSAWEGFPLALCEAMICGLPALAADCPTGPREIMATLAPKQLKHPSWPEITPNGALLPVIESETDVKTWVDAIIYLLDREQLRTEMRDRAKKRMLEYDKANVSMRWYKLIEEICKLDASSLKETN